MSIVCPTRCDFWSMPGRFVNFIAHEHAMNRESVKHRALEVQRLDGRRLAGNAYADAMVGCPKLGARRVSLFHLVDASTSTTRYEVMHAVSWSKPFEIMIVPPHNQLHAVPRGHRQEQIHQLGGVIDEVGVVI